MTEVPSLLNLRFVFFFSLPLFAKKRTLVTCYPILGQRRKFMRLFLKQFPSVKNYIVQRKRVPVMRLQQSQVQRDGMGGEDFKSHVP